MTREIEFLNPPELMKPVGFSHAAETRGGRTLFLAGQVAKDRDGRVVGTGDLVAQFRRVCENLKTLVTAAGGRLTDVAKLTIYVLDAGESVGGELRDVGEPDAHHLRPRRVRVHAAGR